MFFLSIDIGSKNCGISIFKIINNKIFVKCILDNWKDISVLYLNNFLKFFKIDNSYTIIIEKQLRGRKNIFIHGFLNAYFQNLNYKIINSNSFSFNINIKSYKQRKKMSEYYFNQLVNINSNIKKDDIADSLCMGLININTILNIYKTNNTKLKIIELFLKDYDINIEHVYVLN
jgi:hypothetical protein